MIQQKWELTCQVKKAMFLKCNPRPRTRPRICVYVAYSLLRKKDQSKHEDTI